MQELLELLEVRLDSVKSLGILVSSCDECTGSVLAWIGERERKREVLLLSEDDPLPISKFALTSQPVQSNRWLDSSLRGVPSSGLDEAWGESSGHGCISRSRLRIENDDCLLRAMLAC